MRTAVTFVLTFFRVDNREAMGAADNRAVIIQQATVVKQERAAFVIRMFGNMSANFIGLLIGQAFQSFSHRRRFDRKNSY
jgi:hypothetical protein